MKFGMNLLFPCFVALSSCVGYQTGEDQENTATESTALTHPNQQIKYNIGIPVPQNQLVDLGPPSNLGGTVLEGDPRISARIDYQQGGMTAGVFQATRGKIRVVFPFTEHATIIAGQVTITDEAGITRRYFPGDSYFIRQGSVVIWDVRGAFVQKSFFNIVQP